MSTQTRLVNIAFKAYAQTTVFSCELEDIKIGEFVIVPSWNGNATGRIVSFAQAGSFSLKRPKRVLRRATPEEINEVADIFGIAKNPAFADTEEEDESFLTNSGYGTKELNKMLKHMQQKRSATSKSDADNEAPSLPEEKASADVEAKAAPKHFLKEDANIPGYWRYVAIGILALYFLKDYLFD